MRASIAIVGSGFAGSIAATVLARQGHEVFLLERARHPRFTLGESSTPLAALSLERLAERWGLAELDAMAAWGRWGEHLPGLRRGLKRGFTFYAHAAGRSYRNGSDDSHRLLVAASPNDAVADCHWLRADVDAFLAERAAEAGAHLLEGVSIVSLEPAGDGFRLTMEGADARSLRVTHLVDASGSAGFLAAHLPAARRIGPPLATTLIAGHFKGTESFVEIARSGGASLAAGPYPDERAAVHHLLEDAWLYWLPFDHGTVSLGLVSRRPPAAAARAEERLRNELVRYPTLARCLESAEAVTPLVTASPASWLSARAAGERWVLLPGAFAFHDPLFSTGIAWSLLAVERLADWGLALREGGGGGAPSLLRRYGDLLELEAAHVGRLIDLAWSCIGDFDRFAAVSLLYFAAASWSEAKQRLCPEAEPTAGWRWQAFLGADDATIAAWPSRAQELLCAAPDAEALRAGVAQLIESRDVAGLGTAGRRVPVSLEALVTAAEKLGLDPTRVVARLGRLRGFTPAAATIGNPPPG